MLEEYQSGQSRYLLQISSFCPSSAWMQSARFWENNPASDAEKSDPSSSRDWLKIFYVMIWQLRKKTVNTTSLGLCSVLCWGWLVFSFDWVALKRSFYLIVTSYVWSERWDIRTMDTIAREIVNCPTRWCLRCIHIVFCSLQPSHLFTGWFASEQEQVEGGELWIVFWMRCEEARPWTERGT